MGNWSCKDSEHTFKNMTRRMNTKLRKQAERRRALRECDLFVLDNSLRESTVGQLRGHTIDNKWKIYEEIKKVGFQHMIVASFSHMTRIGDTFCRQLAEKEEDFGKFYAFTEFVEFNGVKGVPDTKNIPVGLRKMKELGLRNPIMEIDLVYEGCAYGHFNMATLCDFLSKRMKWVRENLAADSRIVINLRDLPDAMVTKPERVFKVVRYLSSLPPKERPFALIFEESGKYLPEELGVWTASVRKVMNDCGFKDGHLLVHVHEQWGMANAVQLECIVNGATGIWASVCEEGAAIGHACSSVTLMNMIRAGNKHVLKRYNCTALRKAAQNVTRITTGQDAHPKQVIYGERALDIVIGMGGMAQTKADFDMAEFFDEKPPMRMTTLASPKMIVDRLKNVFGEDVQFTEEIGRKMLEVMLEDLHQNRKEEYMSEVGLAVLFDRSGGQLTEKMADVVAKDDPQSLHTKRLIAEIRTMWDEYDLKEEKPNDDHLEFDSFYNGFMAPYFGCYRCDTTKKALKAIDMDEDGKVDWKEFALYLKWAAREYPIARDAEELLSIAFRKGIVPAMQDVLLNQECTLQSKRSIKQKLSSI